MVITLKDNTHIRNYYYFLKYNVEGISFFLAFKTKYVENDISISPMCWTVRVLKVLLKINVIMTNNIKISNP